MDQGSAQIQPPITQNSNFFQKYPWFAYVLVFIGVVLLFDLVYLTVNSFLIKEEQAFIPQSQVVQNSFAPLPTQSPTFCPVGCLSEIIAATSSSVVATAQSIIVPTSTAAPTQTPTPTVTPTSSPNEYFIPIGSGQGNYTTWTNVPGLGVTLNTLYYQNISSVTFEATIWVPTGNQTASVQLYNTNTYQTVANSQLSVSGGTPTLVVAPISLTSGTNFYQVQLSTQLGYTTYIQQARIRIQTN